MKRLLTTLALALSLCATAPSCAHAWWWSHHNSPGAKGAGANLKAAKTKKQKPQKQKVEHLYNSPKSWGWWHKSPGPAGAGS
jgi:hypothetical protein